MVKRQHSSPRTISRRSAPHPLTPQEELRLLDSIFDHITEELLLIRKDGRIVYANEAAARGLGYSKKVLLASKVFDFFKHRVSRRQWQIEHFSKIKKKRKPVSFVVKRVMNNRRMETVKITAIYQRYNTHEYIFLIASNITEKIPPQIELQKSDKMIALGHFVAGTAQEIKHPLQAILFHLERMIQKYQNRDFEYISYKEFTEMMNMLQNIHHKIRHCCDITNRLLLLSKKKVGFKENNCDINMSIRSTTYRMSEDFRSATVRLSLKLAQRLPHAPIDPIEFEQVLKNIVMNAIQSMPSGGRLFIRTFYKANERRIHIEFKDEGTGISRENLPHVFEPFFTTKQKASGQGVGLGLSVVSSIIKGYKGDVSIKSSLRQGTLVTVILPIAEGYQRF